MASQPAEWDSTPKGGSALVKEMQKWASAGMDGYIGPQTILAWQKKLGTPIDGTVSSPSCHGKKTAEVVQPEIEKRILKDPVLCYTGR